MVVIGTQLGETDVVGMVTIVPVVVTSVFCGIMIVIMPFMVTNVWW